MDRTNEQRAESAFRTLQVYLQRGDGDEGDMEASIVDLVSDLLHLGEQYGFDAEYVTRVALSHFNAEQSEVAAQRVEP